MASFFRKGKGKAVDDEDDNNSKKKVKSILEKKPLSDIAMFLTPEAYQKLDIAFNDDLDAVLWYNKISRRAVFVDDILRVMKNDFMSTNVIDAYVSQLCKKHPAIADRSLFISVNSWDQFMRDASIQNYDNKVMNEIVCNTSTKELVFIPICTGGRRNTANHFTLLVRNMMNNAWFFYNSKLARLSKKQVDPYFPDAEKVVHYVDKGLRLFGANWGEGSEIHCVTDIAQQPSSTNDCGTFVCYYMFQIAIGQEVSQKMNLSEVHRLKANLINTILS